MEANRFKVTNIPENVYDDYLVMTFGTVVEGLKVKTQVVSFDAEKATAIVDVETSEAVKRIFRNYQEDPSAYDVNGKRLHVEVIPPPKDPHGIRTNPFHPKHQLRIPLYNAVTKEKIKNCSSAIDGLLHSQAYTAHFLSLSLQAVSDHPDIFRLILHTANSAKDQYSRVFDCIMKVSDNFKHVVNTLLPMIVEGIDTEMPELITAGFEQVQEIAKQMHSEAEKTFQRYVMIQTQLQENIGDIYLKHGREREQYLDATGLITASRGQGQVSAQIIRINEFCGQLVVSIGFINGATMATLLYRSRSGLLRDKVKNLELDWKTIIAVCDRYVSVCKNGDSESIEKLYEFPSEPLARMSEAERRERQADIAEQLKRRIEEL